DVVDTHDVWVSKRGDRAGFQVEPGQLDRGGVSTGTHHLEDDGTVVSKITGKIGDAHASDAQFLLDVIAINHRYRRCSAHDAPVRAVQDETPSHTIRITPSEARVSPSRPPRDPGDSCLAGMVCLVPAALS